VGPRGRGVTDHLDVPTADVDVMMGTFTKSFGSVGGYVAGSKEMVAALRRHSAGSLYAPAMSPPAAQQVNNITFRYRYRYVYICMYIVVFIYIYI